jgi:lipopolysaccharide export system protein LptC
VSQRIILLAVLAAAAVTTAWLLRNLTRPEAAGEARTWHDPDYYMEDFTTVTMREDGSPKSRLEAEYMAHYPDNDTTELLEPRMQLYRQDRPPMYVSADKGWVTQENQVILLRGDVQMWEEDESGQRTLEVNTSAARILVEDDYAETDMPATVVSRDMTISGTGMRAWFTDSRLEVLKHEKTIIDAGPSG